MQTVYYKNKVVGTYNEGDKRIMFYNTPEGKEAETELLKGHSVSLVSRGTGCVNKDGYVIPDQFPPIFVVENYHC